jgi:Flp pilus assembly protein TadD
MDVPTLRKLVALDEHDALSRFALGKKLFEVGQTRVEWEEAAEHLRRANAGDPNHLATYHILAQVLIRLGRVAEARPILEKGLEKAGGVGEGMGRDLGPVLAEMLQQLSSG